MSYQNYKKSDNEFIYLFFKINKQMTFWGYQVDLDVYVYSNAYVTLSIHVKRKRKKKVTVCKDEKITMKISLSQ